MGEHDGAQRSVRLAVEVPGTVGDVWKTVATGPGLTSWFLPTEVDGRIGGDVLFHFGPYGTDVCEVTGWDPPRRFEFSVPQRDRIITHELVVVRLGPQRCRVEFCTGGFGTDKSWDEQVAAMAESWPVFFQNLVISRTNFPDRPCAMTIVNGSITGDIDDAWALVRARLGVDHLVVGEHVTVSGDDRPRLVGKVARHQERALMLVVEEPGPAVIVFGVQSMGGDQVHVGLYLYCYDDDPEAEVRVLGRAWQAWMDRWFPFEMPTLKPHVPRRRDVGWPRGRS
jgi:uncharacterized protein YndB with AHSA1/START domain